MSEEEVERAKNVWEFFCELKPGRYEVFVPAPHPLGCVPLRIEGGSVFPPRPDGIQISIYPKDGGSK